MSRISIKFIWLLPLLFCSQCIGLYSQNQAIADSIEALYLSGKYKAEEKLDLLNDLAEYQANTEKKLLYSEELISLSTELGSKKHLYEGLLMKGTALRLKSDLSNALESFFAAAKLAQGADLGATYVTIADVYSIMGNHQNSVNYYTEAIDILRIEGDSIRLASALLNAGDEYFNNGELDTALKYFKESEVIFSAKDHKTGIAYNIGNEGLVYAEQGKDKLARLQINRAIEYLKKLEDYYPISVYLMYMSDIYARQNDFNTAISYAQRSLELAHQYGLKEQISDANLKLSNLFEKKEDHENSLKYYKDHIAYRDSVNNIESIQKMADLRTDYEVSQKQTEIDLLEKEKELQQLKEIKQRNFMYASFVALLSTLLLLLGLYRRNIYIKRTNKIIEKEKDRSDHLLLNILPKETATELKEHGKVMAKRFESVSVLFTDFKEFTHHAEQLSPERLVESVDFYFSKFDEIVDKYRLEKIKTIGDSYMCAGGIPFKEEDHAYRIVSAALEMMAFVESVKKDDAPDLPRYDMRIGINSGPVVAGVVGTKKFAYDIWGDTVNIASRMESNSEIGKINISENTYNLIKEKVKCEHRGQIEVKNRGLMGMYFVDTN